VILTRPTCGTKATIESTDRVVQTAEGKARRRSIVMSYASGPRRALPLGGSSCNDREAHQANYVGPPKQLSAFDVMKKLLDFFQEAMLYRAESVPIRRFARSRVQSAEIRRIARVISLRDFDRRTEPKQGLQPPTDKAMMDMSLELIRTKIAELETKIADLRVTERELMALGAAPAERAKAERKPRMQTKSTARTKSTPRTRSAGPRKTIGAAITEVLGQHGPLEVAEIADQIQSTGRDINRRTVSYSLQAMKKQGLVKAGDGKWGLSKSRATSARA
jgi:hypothetical protein